jgi:hypothetical protein
MIRVFVIAVLVAGCSYTPVADLRVSGDKAQLYQRDVVECRQLVIEATPYLQIGGSKIKMLNDCLRGRGHSVLGV